MAKYLVFKEDTYVDNTPLPYSKQIRPGEKFLVTDETDYTYTFERLGRKLTVGKSSENETYSVVVDDEAGKTFCTASSTASAKEWWDAVEKPDTTVDKDIMPRKAWNEARINDLRTAIRCALDAGREIPAEWVEELNDLLAEVE